MARIGVNYQDVAKAAVQLTQQDKVPTVDAVRVILGTGSKSTIAPLLKAWKAKQTGISDAEQTGLPSDLLASVKNLYEGMQQQATERIETVQAQAKGELEAAKRESLETQKANDNLESQLTKYEASIEKLTHENESLQTDLRKEQQAHATVETQHEALQQRLEDRSQEVVRLNTHLKQAQENLDHYRDTAQKQREQERAGFDRQLLSAEQALKQTQQENHALRHNLGLIENSFAKLEAKRDQLQATNKVLTEQNHQQSEEILQVQRSLADLVGRYEAAQQANKESAIKVQTQEEQLMQLEKQAAVGQDKIQALTATNDKAEGRIEALRNENTILMQEKANIEGQFKQLQRSL
ncbi:MAG: DNA-binding protein [Gammaproteobacteria bacterium]|nr:DNA-binding protein [Gammaproteobacteria bacterium]MCF6261392.1 DNA-binding protein [Gammaproteobacteria bacterium]